jgi:hypothetical protein
VIPDDLAARPLTSACSNGSMLSLSLSDQGHLSCAGHACHFFLVSRVSYLCTAMGSSAAWHAEVHTGGVIERLPEPIQCLADQ